MKVGLVLEGGGMRGLYTAGVLDAFLEAGIKVDGVVSVSAGALFGVNYLSNQPQRALRYNKRFMGDRRYMSFWSWLTTGNFVNKEFSYYKVPMELDVFDQEAFADSGVPFYVVTTDIETGKPDYIKIDHVFEQWKPFEQVPPYLWFLKLSSTRVNATWMVVCLIVSLLILWKIWALINLL